MDEIRFSLTQEDLWRFTLYSLSRRRLLFIVLLLVLIAAALFPLILNSQPFTPIALFPLLMAVFVVFFFLWRLQRRVLKAAH